MSIQAVAAVLGPIAAIIAAVMAARTADKSKRIDKDVDITKLQMETWQRLLAEERAVSAELRKQLVEERASVIALSRLNEELRRELARKEGT